jgi:signal transduction histidine kinase
VSEDPTRQGPEAVAEYARLLSLVVHELRTPTSVVAGYLRMLHGENSGPTTEHQRRMIEEAEKSCERLVTIINEIGEVARLDTGSLPVRTTSTDVFELVREVSGDVRTAEHGAVTVRFLGPDRGAMCLADRARLGAAFSAFMTAIAREQTDDATLAVERRILSENGASRALIVMARHEIAPDLYSKPPEPINERRGGLGLALPIARRVVEAHGGRVWSPLLEATPGSPQHTVVVTSFPLT